MMTKPWHEFRSVIVQLYISEGRTLKDVKAIMKVQYGFEASIRSYRQHFDSWGVGKYNCKKREIRRRNRAHSRNLLPSPPATPMVPQPATMDMVRTHVITPPESLTSSSSSRSSQDTSSTLSDLSPRQRLVAASPHFSSYFEAHHEVAVRVRAPQARGNAGGPSTGAWGEADLHTVLRNPNMSDGMLPNLTVGTPNMPAKAPSKYLSSMNVYHDVEWGRSSPYQLSNTEPEYYRIAYQDTVPRCMPDQYRSPPASFHRSAEYQQPLPSPASAPRSAMEQRRSVERIKREEGPEESQLSSFDSLSPQ
ncbi:Fc.00g040590.m01.CDS01 [Cosmosporella sp. VM-42]